MKWLVLLMIFNLSDSEPQEDIISIHNGIYFLEFKQITPYVQTIPLVFSTNLPNLRKISEKFNGIFSKMEILEKHQKYESILMLKNNYLSVFEQYELELEEFKSKPFRYFDEKSVNGAINAVRDFFGDILQTCCRTLTHRDGQKFYQNEESIQSQHNILKDSVISDHKLLFEASKFLENLTKNLDEQSKFLDRNFSTIDRRIKSLKDMANLTANFIFDYGESLNILNYFWQKIYLEFIKISNILNSCKNHKLTANMISHEMLSNHLEKLNKKLNELKYESAVPLSSLEEFYHSNLINCLISMNKSEHTLEIQLQIPIIPLNSVNKIYELKIIPFKSNNQICRFKIDFDAINLDESTSIVTPIKRREECNLKSKFCLLPKFRTIHKVDDCLTQLYFRHNMSTLLKHCQLECNENWNINPIVIEISESKFSITNFHKIMTINVLDQTTQILKINNTHPGSIILNVPCYNQIVHIDEIGFTTTIINPSLPCIPNIDGNLQIRYALPKIILNENYISNFSIVNLPKYKDENEIMIHYKSFNWTQGIEKLSNISKTEDFEKNLKDLKLKFTEFGNEDSTFSFIHFIFLIWLSAISLIIVVSAYFVFLNFFDSKNIKNIIGKNTDSFNSEISKLNEITSKYGRPLLVTRSTPQLPVGDLTQILEQRVPELMVTHRESEQPSESHEMNILNSNNLINQRTNNENSQSPPTNE